MKFFLLTLVASASAQSVSMTGVYNSASCGTNPSVAVTVPASGNCTAVACNVNSTISLSGTNTCGTDSKALMTTFFAGKKYLLVEVFNSGGNCASSSLVLGMGILADGSCLPSGTNSSSYKVTAKSDGSIDFVSYTDTVCATGSTQNLPASQLNTCLQGVAKYTVVTSSALTLAKFTPLMALIVAAGSFF